MSRNDTPNGYRPPSHAGPPRPQHRPHPLPHYPPPQHAVPYPTAPFNPYTNLPGGGSGGYNPYGGYGGFTTTPGYAQPIPPSSFGQSLFRPTAPPDGYSYSPTYLQPPVSRTIDPTPPAKKQKPNQPISNGVNGVLSWRNCSVAGCKFVGPGDQVEIHEGDRHLIFPNGKPTEKSEEEERFARRKGPAPMIEGTNISLQTEEDIAKWIDERKSKWPSSKRVAQREEERRAAIARGDIPERGRGRGRGRGGMFGRRDDLAAQAENWGRAPVEREGGGRGRGRDRGQGRGGRGRGAHRETRHHDHGWSNNREQVINVQQSIPTIPAKHQSSGLVRIGDYDSSVNSDEDNSDSSLSSDTISSHSDSETSHSDLQNTRKNTDAQDTQEMGNEEVVKETKVEVTPVKPICKFFAKSGRCKRGDACGFAHTTADQAGGVRVQPRERKKMPRQPPAKKVNPFERPSMLGALLANPIQNTLSQLSQTIRFLVANDMLQGVELKPGQAEELERDKVKVVMMDKPESADNAVDLVEPNAPISPTSTASIKESNDETI